MIVFGVTFIAFLTATVTSEFVSAGEQDAREHERQRAEAAEEEVRAAAFAQGTARHDRGKARQTRIGTFSREA
jgi:hypothetical protein